ncbi:hypothetical protein [Streptomyces griseorubiginosus]|uniref:hypothetical protein n=1 Tax=Streptomyces griseorubiginosus TaxID=67304 RepID=UPI002E805A89|nr:hypothetical protein [Streptomyces griseorubiginosus]WUB46789.1 hypothetical protein OHN19_27045 [Streptomyces griseorubiginosus]WUB55311.1 hypothetical protein OG942_27050 [Streptomyces griseorubiginosus]
MPAANEEQYEVWKSLKPTAAYAVRELSSALEGDDSTLDDLVDAYLFAKRQLAQSMRALMLSQLPPQCPEFAELHDRIEAEMKNRYADRIPERFLKAPYGSKVHELLFMILLQALGKPVDSGRLRVLTADRTHSERRARELRELGFNITTSAEDGSQFYTLVDLEIDYTKVPELIAKAINKAKDLGGPEKARLTAKLFE